MDKEFQNNSASLASRWWSGSVMQESKCEYVVKSVFDVDACKYNVLVSDVKSCWYEFISSSSAIDSRIKEMNPNLEISSSKFLSHLQRALVGEVELVSCDRNKLSNVTKLSIRFGIGSGIYLLYYFNLQAEKQNQTLLMREQMFWPVLELSKHLLSVCNVLRREIEVRDEQIRDLNRNQGKQNTAGGKSSGQVSNERKLDPLLDYAVPSQNQDVAKMFSTGDFADVFSQHSPGCYLMRKLHGMPISEIDREKALEYIKCNMTISMPTKEGKDTDSKNTDTLSSKPEATNMKKAPEETSHQSPSKAEKEDPEQRMAELRRKLADEESKKKKKAKVLKL